MSFAHCHTLLPRLSSSVLCCRDQKFTNISLTTLGDSYGAFTGYRAHLGLLASPMFPPLFPSVTNPSDDVSLPPYPSEQPAHCLQPYQRPFVCITRNSTIVWRFPRQGSFPRLQRGSSCCKLLSCQAGRRLPLASHSNFTLQRLMSARKH